VQVWQRIRGVLGNALAWGAVYAVGGAALFLNTYRPWGPLTLEAWEPTLLQLRGWIAMGGMWGIACGAAFGIALLITERRKAFQQLTTKRLVGWGAVAGGLVPLLLYARPILAGWSGATSFALGLTVESALAGALCAGLTFAAARRAPPPDQLSGGTPKLKSLQAAVPHTTRSGSKPEVRVRMARAF
jgi:hypothetical protein